MNSRTLHNCERSQFLLFNTWLTPWINLARCIGLPRTRFARFLLRNRDPTLPDVNSWRRNFCSGLNDPVYQQSVKDAIGCYFHILNFVFGQLLSKFFPRYSNQLFHSIIQRKYRVPIHSKKKNEYYAESSELLSLSFAPHPFVRLKRFGFRPLFSLSFLPLSHIYIHG